MGEQEGPAMLNMARLEYVDRFGALHPVVILHVHKFIHKPDGFGGFTAHIAFQNTGSPLFDPKMEDLGNMPAKVGPWIDLRSTWGVPGDKQ